MKIEGVWESKYVRVCPLSGFDDECSIVLRNLYAEAAARNRGFPVLKYGYAIELLYSKEEAEKIAQTLTSISDQIEQGTYRLTPERVEELHRNGHLQVTPLEEALALIHFYLDEVPGPILGDFPGGWLGYELD